MRDFCGKQGDRHMKLIWEGGKGKIGFAAVSWLRKTAGFLSSEGKQQMQILDRGMRPYRVFKSQQFLVINFVLWRLKKS